MSFSYIAYLVCVKYQCFTCQILHVQIYIFIPESYQFTTANQHLSNVYIHYCQITYNKIKIQLLTCYSGIDSKIMKTVFSKNEQRLIKQQQMQNFPIIPDQIHKVPENIRRAIKVGKHRRGTKDKNILNIEQFNSTVSNLQFHKEKDKIGTDLHVRQIFSFIQKKQDQQTYINQDKLKDQENGQLSNQLQPQNQPHSHLYHMYKGQMSKLRSSGDRMLYAKKKLSPLKKGLSIQPRSLPSRDNRSLKVTFLNIEKLQLIKMYQNIDQSKQAEKPHKVMSMTSSMVSTNKSQYGVQNFLQSASFSNNKTPFLKRSLFSNIQSPTKKNKPFQPPFERYYYRDFIWKIAYNHNLYHQSPDHYEKKFRVFIGKGNNSLLIKSLFKRRRAWWSFTERIQDAHFIWTQTKINNIFALQPKKEPFYSEPIQDSQQIDRSNKKFKEHKFVISQNDYIVWKRYFSRLRKVQQMLDQTMKKRNKYFGREKVLQKIKYKSYKMHNHLPNNYIIGNKKALFYTMSQYYERINKNVFEYLPVTFHIQDGLQDNEYLKFLNMFYDRARKIRARNKVENAQQNQQQNQNQQKQKSIKNMWIVKPGQFSNRGNGITVCMSLDEIKQILKKKQRHDNGNLKTYILQSYLEKPFLYQRRKFDIRHYIMMTSINGIIRGYWYEKGYIRTTSFEYTINNSLTSVHLTNDAVQKYLPQYGKYQRGNKVSYADFHKYLQKQYGKMYDFFGDIYPQIKNIATDAMKACSLMIDPQKKGNNFEIFGLDFMIDGQFHPWLIEINNNPCLETSCPLLADIIPEMVENALKICIDPIFCPPANFHEKHPKFNQNTWLDNKFEMVYDSSMQEKQMLQLYQGKIQLGLDYKQLQKQQDQIFEDDGIQLQD